jgi:hypothetical protein
MGWLSRTFYGVDLDEEQARQDRLNTQLATLNQRSLERGTWDEATFEEAEQHREQSYISDVQAPVRDAFNTELNNRAANFRDFAGDAVGAVALTPFKLIPPIVWLIGIAFLAFKFGLFDGLFRKLKN